MKRFLFLCLITAFISISACDQKEQQKPQYQFPVTQPPAQQTGPVGAPHASQPPSPQALPGSPMMSPLQSQAEENVLRDILKKDPKNLQALISLGNILMDTGRFQEATVTYGKALELDPKNVDVRVDMGTCYRNIGKPDIAVAEYRKGIQINPNHLNAHRNLGVVLAYDLKQYSEAAKAFETALKIAPNQPDAAQLRQEIEKFRAAAR